MKAHSFAKWVVRHHVEDETPVGDLARDLREDYDFPAMGGRVDLRVYLYERGARPELLDAFDTAWSATCVSPGCGELRAGGASSFCPGHGGRRHQAGGAR